MIITVDGLDGAGKSTLAKNLAKSLDFKYIEKPLYKLLGVENPTGKLYDDIVKLQDIIYNKTNSDLLKSWFTGMSLLYLKEEMGNENLIIDRGLLSAYVFNGNNKSLPVFDFLLELGIWFDVGIFLTVSQNERISRMSKRKDSDDDVHNDKIINLNYKSVQEFLKLHPELPVIIINTDNKTPDDILKEALFKLKEIKKDLKVHKKTR
ncbi:MAG: hypothetical protein E7166_05425 [Firmicutes bacterium]|nr:hypothetical protein [Bacillota bacterium]